MRPSFRFGAPTPAAAVLLIESFACAGLVCLFVCSSQAAMPSSTRSCASSPTAAAYPPNNIQRARDALWASLGASWRVPDNPPARLMERSDPRRRKTTRQSGAQSKGPGGTLQACLVLRVARTHWNQLDSDYFEARVQAVAQRVRQGRRWPLWPNGRECVLSGNAA